MSFFDHHVQASGTPIGNWIKRRSRTEIYNILNQYFPNKQFKILEIGPGFGELAKKFRDEGYSSYKLVEPNPTLRTSLISDGFRVENYLIPNLDELDNSQNAIILIDVFEHLNGPQEANRFIAEAYRVLENGGYLCIYCPDYLHWNSDFFNSDFSHSNITTIRRTIQLFNNFGFSVAYMNYFSGYFSGIFATFFSYLVRFFGYFLNGNSLNDRLYKIKLVFLRQYLIIGTKIAE